MIVGSLSVIIYKNLEGGIFDMYELLPGFILAWIAILIFSRVGEGASSENKEIFSEVRDKLK